MPLPVPLRAGALLLALAALCPSAYAGSERTCDATDGDCPTPLGCYHAYWPVWNPPEETDGYCWHQESDLNGTVKVKFPNPDVPGTARLHCDLVSNCRWSCVAAPYDASYGFTYHWSKNGPRLAWDPTPQPYENFASVVQQNTQGGIVTVEVVSPSGTSSSVSLGIPSGSCIPF